MSKAEVVKWCLDHSFELIDMICEEEEQDEDGNWLCCYFSVNNLAHQYYKKNTS